jgi:hypothetical protein
MPSNAPVGTIDIVLPDGPRRLVLHAQDEAPPSRPADANGPSGDKAGPDASPPPATIAAATTPFLADATSEGAPLSAVLSCEGRPDDVFLIAPAQLSAAASVLSDPRPLLDRTVLAIPAAAIQRITIAHVAGTTNAIARDANGLFAAPPGQVLAEGALEALLSAAALLRADDVEAVSPTGLLPYGLDYPAFEVAFDLADEAGLRRTLAIGSRTPDNGGRYAMVKGHDIVFILPRESADAFMRPLYAPESPEIGAPPPAQ